MRRANLKDLILNAMNRNQGVTLIDFGFLVGMVLMVWAVIFSSSSYVLNKLNHMDHYVLLETQIQKKIAQIKTIGYWSGDINTDQPLYDSPLDPAVMWAKDMAGLPIKQGQIQSQFYTLTNDGLQVSDINTASGTGGSRIKKVSIKLIHNEGLEMERSIFVSQYPSQKSLNASMIIMQHALAQYQSVFGYYPSNLTELVDQQFLDEIPNDPYTKERSKQSRTEEVVDWHYDYDSNTDQWQLFAHSNPQVQRASGT